MAEFNTHLTLYANTYFRPSYDNVIKFDSQQEMDDLFNGDTFYKSYENSHFKFKHDSGRVKVGMTYKDAQYVNYMRFTKDGLTYYAFVFSVEQLNKSTVALEYEIDVWNTYQQRVFQYDCPASISQRHESLLATDGTPYIVPFQQGFKSTSTHLNRVQTLPTTDWLVFVTLPSAKVAGTERKGVGYPASPKSFRYFTVPVNLASGMTQQYSVNGTLYPTTSIASVIEKMSNKFDEVNNTVNQIVNIYLTKSIGLSYTITGDTVKTVEITTAESDKINAVYLSGDGQVQQIQGSSDYGLQPIVHHVQGVTPVTLSAQMLNQAVAVGRRFKVLPSLVISQMWYESNWGQSAVAKSDNNWSGMKYFGGSVGEGGSPYTSGSPIPSNEYGTTYRRYATSEAWFADYIALIAGSNYGVSGQSTFDGAVKGLFTVGGARYNYAETPYSEYASTMRSVRQAINNKNNGVMDRLDAMVYNGGWKSVSDGAQVSGTQIQPILDLQGQRLGNGECYAVASLFSKLNGGAGLGAGVTDLSDVIGDTYSASNIGSGYNWGKHGWTAKYRPELSEVPIPSIVTYHEHAVVSHNGSRRSYANPYGHVVVAISKDIAKGTIDVIEQNVAPYGRTVGVTRGIAWDASQVNHVIAPPTAGANTFGANIQVLSNDFAVLEIIYMRRFTDVNLKDVDVITELEEVLFNKLSRYGHTYVESQVMSSELCNIKLHDANNNAYDYKPEFFTRGAKEINLRGGLGDNNHVKAYIDEYMYSTKGKFITNTHGMIDASSRSLTVVSDATATMLQQSKNALDAQQLAINENRENTKQAINLSELRLGVDSATREITAQYQVDSANLNTLTTLASLGGVTAHAMSGNAVYNAMGMPMNAIGAETVYKPYAENMQRMNYASDGLRKIELQNQNMMKKMAIEQQQRSLNATLSDKANHPVTIANRGNDLAYYVGNRIDGYYLSYETADDRQLNNAQWFFKRYGVIVNEFTEDIRTLFKLRKYFVYIKANDIHFKGVSILQEHLTALENVFASGVRIWRWESVQDKRDPFNMMVKNV